MKNIARVVFIHHRHSALILSVLLLSFPIFADVPLSYTGRLVNANGSPVTGPVNLKVELGRTDGANPPSVICARTLSSVPLSNGVFHLKLDFSTAQCGGDPVSKVLADTPPAEAAAIRVTDLTNSKAYTFQAIHAIPFASVSSYAKSLAQMGAVAGQVLSWNGTQWVPASAGGTGSVTSVATGAGLTGGPITASGTISIATAGITAAMLSQMGASTGHALKWNGSTWAPAADSGITSESDPTVQGWAKNTILSCTTAQTLRFDALLNSGAGGLYCSNISLGSDSITEGSTNLFYTDARAKSASVANALADGINDVAPSQNAVFDALALKQNSLSSSSNITVGAFQSSPTLSGSSSVEYGVRLTPTINQSSTAGYTALFMNVNETATGSGLKKLLDLQVGGISKFSIDANGTVTSGTATQGTTANYTSAGGSQLVVGYDPTNKTTMNVDSLGFTTLSAAGTAAGFNFTGGNVGIGSPSPQYPLDVNGNVGIGNRLYMSRDGSNFSWIGVRGTEVEPKNIGIGLGSTTAGAISSLLFSTDGLERMRILADGKVGINTTTPIAALQVNAGPVMTGGYVRSMTLHSNHPSLQFKGISDTNHSGYIMYDAAASTESMRFRVGMTGDDASGSGTEALTLRANGNVGIGTAAPSYKFEVRSSDAGATNSDFIVDPVTSDVRVGRISTTVNTSNRFAVQNRLGQELFVVNPSRSSANVTSYFTTSLGVGTSSPTNPFEVSGAGSTNGLAKFTDTSASGTENQLRIRASTDSQHGLVIGKNHSGTSIGGYHGPNWAHIINYENAPLVFGTNNLVNMSILSNGYVGVGTTSPTANFHVSSDLNVPPVRFSSNYTDNSVAVTANGSFAHTYSTADQRYVLSSNPQGDKSALASSGSDFGGLFLGSGTSHSAITAGGSPIRSGNKELNFWTNNDFSAPKMLIGANGNVGIGTSSPQAKLDVNGAIRAKSIRIGSNSTAQNYPNILSYEGNSNTSGSVIIHTSIPRTSTAMVRIHVYGYNYSNATVTDFTVVGYPYPGNNGNVDGQPGAIVSANIIDNGNDGYAKFIGVDAAGNVAVAYGAHNQTTYYDRFTVDAWISNNANDYSQNWTTDISTTAGFNWLDLRPLKSPIKFSGLNVAFGASTPVTPLSVGTGNEFTVNSSGATSISTSIGQSFYSARQAGGGYVYGEAMFQATTENTTTPELNVYFEGKAGTTSKFRVLGNGDGFFAGKLGVGTQTPDATARVHIKGSDVSGTDVVNDGNDRPTVQIEGQWPNLILKGEGNTNHSATIGLWSFDGASTTHQWNMGVGQNSKFSIGYALNQSNPHYALHDMGNVSTMTMLASGNVGSTLR